MSAFLGPIHHWLFNKIRLVEEREKALATALTEKFGDEVNTLSEAGRAKYGDYYDETALEEMIGEEPIHTYLAGAIEKVETREAALIAAITEKFGEDAKARILELAQANGKKVGEAEKEEVDADSADDIYRAVKNTFLDGMPCDHVTDVKQTSEKEVAEIHSDCLHRAYWQSGGADDAFMCEYLGRWLDGFVQGVGVGTHTRGSTIMSGANICEDVYKLV